MPRFVVATLVLLGRCARVRGDAAAAEAAAHACLAAKEELYGSDPAAIHEAHLAVTRSC